MCWSLPPQAQPPAAVPKPAKGKPFAEGSVVTLYYDPDAPEKMFVEGDKSVLGAELLYAGIGVALLVLMVGLMNR